MRTTHLWDEAVGFSIKAAIGSLVTALAVGVIGCGPISGVGQGSARGKADNNTYVDKCRGSHQRVVDVASGINLRKADGSWVQLAQLGDRLLLKQTAPQYRCLDQAETRCYWFREVHWRPAAPAADQPLSLDGRVLASDGTLASYWAATEIRGLSCGMPPHEQFTAETDARPVDLAAPSSTHGAPAVAQGWSVGYDSDGWGHGGRFAYLTSNDSLPGECPEWDSVGPHPGCGYPGQVLGCERGCSFYIQRTFQATGQAEMEIEYRMAQGQNAWAEILVQRHGAGEPTDHTKAQIVSKLTHRSLAKASVEVPISGSFTVFFKVGAYQDQPVSATLIGVYFNDFYQGDRFTSKMTSDVADSDQGYASGKMPWGWSIFKDRDDWAVDAKRHFDVNEDRFDGDPSRVLEISGEQGSFGLQRMFYVGRRTTIKVPVTVEPGAEWVQVVFDSTCNDACLSERAGEGPATAHLYCCGDYHHIDTQSGQTQWVERTLGAGWHSISFKVGRVHGRGLRAYFGNVDARTIW